MQWLAGTWFVIASDAPLWVKGDKVAPTLNYTIRQHGSTYRLLDEVKYTKDHHHKTITGYDKLNNTQTNAFIWRGKGVLFFVKSKWQVTLQDTAGRWAVIAYSKTLFTPEGVDILSRSPALDEATMQHIMHLMQQQAATAGHVSMLKVLPQR